MRRGALASLRMHVCEFTFPTVSITDLFARVLATHNNLFARRRMNVYIFAQEVPSKEIASPEVIPDHVDDGSESYYDGCLCDVCSIVERIAHSFYIVRELGDTYPRCTSSRT